MPDLPADDGATKQSIVSANSSNMFNDGSNKENLGNGIWEDEDARKFYEDLPDLRILVPHVFLESQQQTAKEESSKEATEEANQESATATETEVEESNVTSPDTNDNVGEEEGTNTEMDPSDMVDEAIE